VCHLGYVARTTGAKDHHYIDIDVRRREGVSKRVCMYIHDSPMEKREVAVQCQQEETTIPLSGLQAAHASHADECAIGVDGASIQRIALRQHERPERAGLCVCVPALDGVHVACDFEGLDDSRERRVFVGHVEGDGIEELL